MQRLWTEPHHSRGGQIGTMFMVLLADEQETFQIATKQEKKNNADILG